MIYTIHEIKKLWEKIPLDEDMNLYIHSQIGRAHV